MEKFCLKMCRIYVYIILLGFCSSCKIGEEQANLGVSIFDLAQYINQLEEGHQFSQKKVEKILYINGSEKERINTNDYNAIEDLKILRSSNINRPALIEKYTADTTTLAGITQIHYEAKDPDLNVQTLHVQKKGKELIEIRIEKQLKSIIANSKQVIWFSPKIGYSISNTQNILKGESEDSEIQVNFL